MALTTFKYSFIKADTRTAAMLNEVDRLTPNIPFRPVQGGYNAGGVKASAGTHDRAAIDVSVRGLSSSQRRELVRVMRKVGFAAWNRYVWQGFSGDHIHAVPVSGDLSSGAAAQVRAYLAGRDGLAGNRIDTEDRQYVGMTWERYRAAQVAPKTAPAGRKPLLVDGILGPVTIRDFQMWRGVPKTGKWDRETIIAAQRWVGVAQDGNYGPVTMRAIQRVLGVAQDGVIGPVTIKALQTRLNARYR